MFPQAWTCPSDGVAAIKLHDISRELLSAPVYEGDDLPALKAVSSMAKGAEFNLSSLLACVHAGTHCDAPLHCIENSADIASMPLSCYIGPCRLIELQAGRALKKLEACERLIMKGGARLSIGAAQYIIERGIKAVGTDAISIAEPSCELEVHRMFFSAGVAVIEQLYLENVAEGEYFLFAPPIKIAGADGAFCRAVLLEGYAQI